MNELANFYSDCPRRQKREVSDMLIRGLSDSGSPLSILSNVRNDFMRDIVWKMVAKNWQFFPDDQ